MNRTLGARDQHRQGVPAGWAETSHGKAQMTQARSTAAHIAVVDTTTACLEGSPVAHGAAAARLPAGYDRTDMRVLEWIAAHRRSRRAHAKMAHLAA
jgi:hypothetical protein